ncbi:MAG: hypothetical protein KME49_22735 [Brasilonema octagenarum HA4186-MV1]|jgi:hypothetical protein|nr:hypothetical protein [Brasilonema octagenarum HA4186-MV1]
MILMLMDLTKRVAVNSKRKQSRELKELDEAQNTLKKALDFFFFGQQT